MVGNGVQLCQLRSEIGLIANSPFLSRSHCFSLLADKEDETGAYILPGTWSGSVAMSSTCWEAWQETRITESGRKGEQEARIPVILKEGIKAAGARVVLWAQRGRLRGGGQSPAPMGSPAGTILHHLPRVCVLSPDLGDEFHDNPNMFTTKSFVWKFFMLCVPSMHLLSGSPCFSLSSECSLVMREPINNDDSNNNNNNDT